MSLRINIKILGKNVYHSDRQSSPILGPTPHKISSGNAELRFHECGIEFEHSEPMLFNIIEIYRGVIFGKGHTERCPGGINNNPGKYLSNGKKILKVNVVFRGNSNQLLPPGFNVDHEGYHLTVDIEGRINIAAHYYPGIIRALDSLSQLIERNDETNEEYRIKYAPIEISDKPSYPYRGAMLDTSREYFHPDVIKQMLDGMMLARLNVFHWHFSDTDSIPMYLESYPDMTKYTAFSEQEIYTPEMVKDIVKYAKIRGIKVVPEFEGPGHLNILGKYPPLSDLIGCFRDSGNVDHAYGSPPYAPIDPTSNRTYEFLETFMRDMYKVFDTDYWHLGGDEVEASCWSDLQSVKEFLGTGKYKLKDLQQYYTTKERDIVTKIDSNIRAGYWYQAERLDYHKDDILQYWGSTHKIKQEMEAEPNNYFVLSPSDAYYLDCGYGNQFGDRSWCSPMKSWKQFWYLNPNQYNRGNRLLGGEVCAWSEMNNEFDFLTKMFPRAGAMSFRFWNPGEPQSEGILTEMMMRFQYRLKSYGIPTEKISMRYCEEHTHHCFGI